MNIDRSRAEAIRNGALLYVRSKPCSRGHNAPFRVVNYSCTECDRLKHSLAFRSLSGEKLQRRKQLEAEHYEKNKAKIRKVQTRYYSEKDKPRALKRAAKWVAANPEKSKQAKQKYRDGNREAIHAANKRRYLADRGAQFAHAAARRARRRKAYPAWADTAAIREIYREARHLSDLTGVRYSVDHFYPLAGKLVCGLHVHNNLRVITLEQNTKKGPRHPIEMEPS